MSALAKKLTRACAPRPLRNWLRSPEMSAKWMVNEVRYIAGRHSLVEMRPGWRLRSHPSAYPFAYFAQHADPEQVEEFDAFVAACRPGMTLFDIGAHFGLFSLAALHFGGASARAVALDPSPTATRMLRIQARLNGVADKLTVIQAAAGERTGSREMVAAGVLGAGYFMAPKDHTGGELTRTRETTLDELTETTGLKPTHLKIDVEGDEAAVLRGARRLLTGIEPPLLFLELHHEMIGERGGDPAETLSLLTEFGYTVFSQNGGTPSMEELLSRPLVRVCAKKQSRRPVSFSPSAAGTV